MTIENLDVIDFVYIDNDALILNIADHLDFEGDEKNHLILLQRKINIYLDYIQRKQYEESFPNVIIDKYYIYVHFLYEITKACKSFIIEANRILPARNVEIFALDGREYEFAFIDLS